MTEITWIKLKTEMFNSTKIRLIEKLPEGDTILVIWIKLLTAAGKANCNGYIMLAENIPMNVEEMAVIFDRPLNTIRLALEAFKRYGMVEVDENEMIRIANWEKHQNIDGMEKVRLQNAKRNREYRERKKHRKLAALTVNGERDVSVTSRDGTDIELDIDLEKDISTTSNSDRASEIYAAVQNNIRFNLSPIEQQTIRYWITDYPHDLILEAVKRAVLSNKNTLAYVERILKNWQRKRVTTLQEVQRDDEEFAHAKNKKQRGANYARNEPIVQSVNGTTGDDKWDGLSL